jgi:putative cardiolipin synthase
MRHLVLAALAAALLAGCAALEPVQLPDAPAASPATAPVWQALPPAESGDRHLLLNDGETALDWRLLAIDSATRTIDIQTFLLEPDAIGAAVLDHLVMAADRGVQVRFLIDDSFLPGKDELVMFIHEHANMAFRIFNPFQRRQGDMATRQALNLAEFNRLDHRMHNKAMIVDGQVAIVGGRNLADEYFGLAEGANFRDLELLVSGPVVGDLSRAFATYWNDDWSFPIDRLTQIRPEHVDRETLAETARETRPFHGERAGSERDAAWRDFAARSLPGRSRLLVDAPPRDDPADPLQAPVQVAEALLDVIQAAEDEVVIVSAYLIPTPALETTLKEAVERGVTVRLLTNSIGSNNHVSAHSAYRNHIRALLGGGTQVYEVRTDALSRPAYISAPVADKELALHAKALIIDHDRVFIGSANLDPRSMRINTEMGLLVASEPLNQALRAAVDPDFHPGNAWNLRLDEDGQVLWISGDEVLTAQPARSVFQRLEDWFFSHLPIEDEM